MRILHVPTDVGNHGPTLSEAEKALGHKSLSVVFTQSYLGYRADVILGTTRYRHQFILEIRRWVWLWRALKDYDVIHFNFGTSLAPAPLNKSAGTRGRPWIRKLYSIYGRFFCQIDLPILKFFGKRIIVTYQGDDARQGWALRVHYKHSMLDEMEIAGEAGFFDRRLDCLKAERIKRFNKYADLIYYYNPDLRHVMPDRAKFLPYPFIF